ncbi:MAG TPA: hypothetical protein VMU35_09015, partial [Methylomirabilota bacterium]|nr:hypothetical protein [Methylomirabilota bacterium]
GPPRRLFGLIGWIMVALIFVGVIVYGLSVYLDWVVLQSMYASKADLNWFAINFYHNNTFIVAALLALLFINPIPRRSHLFEGFSALGGAFAHMRGQEEVVSLGPGKIAWFLWQIVKWAIAFWLIAGANGIPGLGNLTVVVTMLQSGLGNWSQVGKVFLLPLAPVSGAELVALMPTMEVQYFLIFDVAAAVVFVAVLRLILMLVRDFARLKTNAWARDLFLILALVVLFVIVDAPYWVMNVATPNDYLIAITSFVSFLVIAASFQFGVIRRTIGMARRKRWIVYIMALFLLVIIIVNLAFVVGYSLNWNNNWTDYEWKPMTMKEIEVTRWAAGIQNVVTEPLSSVPAGNTTTIVSLVRQWDHDASYTKMINQIGVNWMQLSASQIIYLNNHEYWAAPTTINYPTDDWISHHLIYTHAARIIVIDSHTGDYVSVQNAFGVKVEPLIYYGEALSDDVYVHVKGFEEIGNASYTGTPDYTLSGWQRSLWFLVKEGQVGFALSPPQDSIMMLHNRDVYQRVQDILIDGLTTDSASYLVTDGSRIYYCVQVYTNYPIHSGFSGSNYLRFFGVVLVDIENGQMYPYVIAQPDGFLVDFYRQYYSSWKAPPNWLVSQLRYPEDLLGTHANPGQLDVAFQYHVSDPFIWRSGSDFYERPESTEVLYVLETFGNRTDFVGMQLVEYQSSPGKNLAGMFIAYGSDELGKLNLYRISNSTTQLIGPSAALQAVETDDYVRTQLTLLPNYRLGNILLYLIGNHLYYFIPVYINTQVQNAVITKMAFIAVVDATTGAKVAVGADSSQAYYAISGGTPVILGSAERVEKLNSLFTDKGYSLINPSQISANVEIQIANITYTDQTQATSVNATINNFIASYCQKYNATEVYYWTATNGDLNFGVLVSTGGVVKLYYITVQIR